MEKLLNMHKSKLIKVHDEYYVTTDKQTDICYHLDNKEILKVKGVGEKSGEVHHDKGWNKPNEVIFIDTDLSSKLSLKNCQSIERGYDLDELFQREIDELMFTGNLDDPSEYRSGMYKGAKILIELMGDKKFTKNDILIAMICMQGQEVFYEKTFEETQETRKLYIENYIQSLQQTEWDVEIEMDEINEDDLSSFKGKPKLDADGCLILKRVV